MLLSKPVPRYHTCTVSHFCSMSRIAALLHPGPAGRARARAMPVGGSLPTSPHLTSLLQAHAVSAPASPHKDTRPKRHAHIATMASYATHMRCDPNDLSQRACASPSARMARRMTARTPRRRALQLHDDPHGCAPAQFRSGVRHPEAAANVDSRSGLEDAAPRVHRPGAAVETR